MKRVAIMISGAALAGLLLSFAGFAAGRRGACGCAANPSVLIHDPAVLARLLDLDGDQRAAMHALHVSLAADLDACCIRHCGARARLGEILAADEPDPARAGAVVEDMARAYAESERAVLDHIFRVRALLDPAQRERFNQLIMETLCRVCPACEAGGAHRHGEET